MSGLGELAGTVAAAVALGASPPACPPGASDEAPQQRRGSATASQCEAAAGSIVYVERVDPDGDGDAHFVLSSEESITLPGISVVDVRADLRPSPLPGPGDLLAAAGPVYRGSYGQRQIQAVEIAFARAAAIR